MVASASIDAKFDEVQKDFECAICLETLNNPVHLGCKPSHVVCKSCADGLLEQACPHCRESLIGKPSRPAPVFTLALNAWKASQKLAEENKLLKAQLALQVVPDIKSSELFPPAPDKSMARQQLLLTFNQKEISKKRRDLVVVMFAKRARIHMLLRRILGDDGFENRDAKDSKRGEQVARILKAVGYQKVPSSRNDMKESKKEKNSGFQKSWGTFAAKVQTLRKNQKTIITQLADEAKIITDKIKATPLVLEDALRELHGNAARLMLTNELYLTRREDLKKEAQAVWRKAMLVLQQTANLKRQYQRYDGYQKKLTDELSQLMSDRARELRSATNHFEATLTNTPGLFGGNFKRKASAVSKDYKTLTTAELNLCTAIKKSDLNLVKGIYRSDPSIDISCVMSAPDEKTYPALVDAIIKNKPDIVRFILKETNFDVNCTTAFGVSFKETPEKLPQGSADLNRIAQGSTGLFFAAIVINLGILNLFLEMPGIALNHRNNNGTGWGILHFTTNENIWRMMVNAGADYQIKNNENLTPIEHINKLGWDASGAERVIKEYQLKRAKK